MRGVHLQNHLKYTEKAGVAACWLLHSDQYVRKYYCKCYNRDIQVLGTGLLCLFFTYYAMLQCS